MGDTQCRYQTATCMISLGHIHCKRRKYELAASCFEKAKALSRDLGDLHMEATCLASLGKVRSRQGAYEIATSQIEEARRIYQRTGEKFNDLGCLETLFFIRKEQGDYPGAIASMEESRPRPRMWECAPIRSILVRSRLSERRFSSAMAGARERGTGKEGLGF